MRELMWSTLVMVVFAGVVGTDAQHVERQLGALLHHDARVESVELSASERDALGSHGQRAARVVVRLRTDGVVAGEVVVGKHGKRRLRVFVYDGEGNVVSQVEVPLEGDSLTRSGISLLREAVVADVVGLASPQTQAADDAPAANEDDAAADAEPAAREGAGADSATPDDAPTDDTPGDDTPPLRIGVSVGLGFLSRTFTPGATALTPYQAMAVGSLRFAGDLEPTRRLRLDFLAERSLGMITALASGVAATEVVRWQIDASWAARAGAVTLAPSLGVGRRSFHMESEDPMRSPDGDYLYLAAGLGAQIGLGKRALVALAARFEPVVGGAQPTMPTYGRAVRLGYDLDLRLDVQLSRWWLARTEAGWQAFDWSFAGGGGAGDRYLGATLSLGARY
jgi:hypothetical protein